MCLEVKNLKVEFHTFEGSVFAVNGVDFTLKKGEILGIVGESGSGKSVATHAILQLVPVPPGKIASGEIIFNNQNLLSLNENELNKIRGKEIAMIFQEPMTSLNPVFTVYDQISEVLKLHFPPMTKGEYQQRVIEALQAVGIPAPEKRLKCYPHELSGGMRQRVMIAMALACRPKILIADEPTTALDVTIQAQILEVINNLRKEYGMAVIFITHNLGVIAETSDKVSVMYAGRIVESGTTDQIFDNPQHPYTEGLLKSIPSYGENAAITTERKELKTIKGVVPSLNTPPTSCSFANRCEYRTDECEQILPQLIDIGEGHMVACIHRG